MTNFYFYNAYGLNIKSSVVFPELITINSKSDVIIHYNNYKSLCKNIYNTKTGFNKILFSPYDILYFLDSEPLFRVRNGKEIIINPETSIDTVFLRYLILYQGFGSLLMQRGNLVLHASSINIKDKAVAFLGWCGSGKSTIVAAMDKMNYSTITDDVLAIGFDKENKPFAFPSFPRVKLCDDVSKYITTELDVALPIIPKIEKYSYNVYKTFSVKPIPLETIYILKQNTKNQITSLKLQDALMELIKNCYSINLFDEAKRSENLNQCAELVNQIPIKCLERSQSLDEIWSLIQLIENDVCSN